MLMVKYILHIVLFDTNSSAVLYKVNIIKIIPIYYILYIYIYIRNHFIEILKKCVKSNISTLENSVEKTNISGYEISPQKTNNPINLLRVETREKLVT